MKILLHILLKLETQVAQAIYEAVLSQGHEVHLWEISNISKNILNAYDLVFLGSPCQTRIWQARSSGSLSKSPSHLPSNWSDYRRSTFICPSFPRSPPPRSNFFSCWFCLPIAVGTSLAIALMLGAETSTAGHRHSRFPHTTSQTLLTYKFPIL